MQVWAEWSFINSLYLVCAVVGGLVFLIKTTLMIIGGDATHVDTDIGFHILTVQGVIGFVMMFGLVGLFLNVGLHTGPLLSSLGAIAAGFATMWGTAKMMGWMKSLQSSGNIEEKNLIGQEGEVYLTIPAGGVGKVHVNVQNRLVEYDAESQDGSELKTGTQVRVVFIKGNNLIVERI